MRFCAPLRFRTPLSRVGVLITVAALSGCDVPTEVPLLDVRWVFPIDDQSISVVELLPATVDTAGGNFVVDVDPFTLVQTLGGLCSACIPLNGQTVFKPAFNLSYNQGSSLPTDVVSAELVSGSISLGIQNNLGFDPLRPAAAANGTLALTVYDVDINGRVLGQVVLDGATASLPNGVLTTVPLPLTPGTITSTILGVAVIDSPQGDTNVLIDINAGFDITMTVGTIQVSSVTVNVDGLTVNIDQRQLDVGGIDPNIVSNVQSGSLVLDVQNPFGVAISVTVEIVAPPHSCLFRRPWTSGVGRRRPRRFCTRESNSSHSSASRACSSRDPVPSHHLADPRRLPRLKRWRSQPGSMSSWRSEDDAADTEVQSDDVEANSGRDALVSSYRGGFHPSCGLRPTSLGEHRRTRDSQ